MYKSDETGKLMRQILDPKPASLMSCEIADMACLTLTDQSISLISSSRLGMTNLALFHHYHHHHRERMQI